MLSRYDFQTLFTREEFLTSKSSMSEIKLLSNSCLFALMMPSKTSDIDSLLHSINFLKNLLTGCHFQLIA